MPKFPVTNFHKRLCPAIPFLYSLVHFINTFYTKFIALMFLMNLRKFTGYKCLFDSFCVFCRRLCGNIELLELGDKTYK